ncbi:Clan CA, family C12, ubiquitin hydrolase-like cysteine peptidase [Trichomonas vaginalis G3]|uniref:Ubiquitin carboxyl-terminal hydrolase n=1 Tax=Trichomonas vaginalis (strain ATCC PRA-98 / G3) TaxID=412133 RepID=A2FJ39_TRIV3|nr:thiol-dependent ubiquitin-specific protease protein [Trichomonas vaginalis G3]EAX95103.1 Clan CA, family C12, ubiquitin hydrolase-like cysteine peptidase [Trichomonas vaginalis G3]KAI5501938.1 thiol-dependent ubiquitin-specific protease protein [Trichomonas vaginalis G3]|eukprot:XP_001308033.1 Clan CA, family C12, ubiquitin hydrolase-like cysteine peptidase [Trichomonas vaginalis G3]
MADLPPLSNDPEILTEYTVNLGVDPDTFTFAEVFSLDPEYISLYPPNPKSLIFLYPYGKKDGPLERRHQGDPPNTGKEPFYLKQTLDNACGTIAIIHSIANNLDSFKLKRDSWIENFINDNKDKTPEERGKALEQDDEVQDAHETTANDDSTPFLEDSDSNHFIAFVPFDGKLWELDGFKKQPICHGECDDFFAKVTKIIQDDFYPNVKDPMETSMVLLCKN